MRAGYNFKALSCTPKYLNPPISQFLHHKLLRNLMLLDSDLLVILANEHLYLYTLAVSPSLGGIHDNTKETTKTMGISLRSSSNDEGPSRVWMAVLEQHSPSSPVFHNLRCFIDASPLLPLPQGCLYKATPWQQQMPIRTASQSFATHSYS